MTLHILLITLWILVSVETCYFCCCTVAIILLFRNNDNDVVVWFSSVLKMTCPGNHVHPSSIRTVCVCQLCHVLALSDDVPSLPCLPFVSSRPLFPPLAGFPMHAKSTVNVGSGDPPRWSSKVNMAPAVH